MPAGTSAESGAESMLDGGKNSRGIGGRVDHVAGAFAALLANAHVDRGQRKGGRFHDAAGELPIIASTLAEQAPVGNGVEIDEDVRVWRVLRQEPSCAR